MQNSMSIRLFAQVHDRTSVPIRIQNGMNSKIGSRRHERIQVSDKLQISWQNANGNDSYALVTVTDVSESGLSFQTMEVIPRGAYVTFRSARLGLHGTASVRHCARKGIKQFVGLEFTGGFKWMQDAADDSSE